MTQAETFSFQSTSHLPDVFSTALVDLFNRVQPGIVQVFTEGRGTGTGIVWDTRGHIITNHHVVARENAQVRILLADGPTLEAKVIQSSPLLDLAVLKVTDDTNHTLKPLSVADSSKLRIGEWLFAVGHPWGQRWVVTAGIMSGTTTARQSRADNAPVSYIKSDVRLAPGNSGGPLLNADGEVVGVNAMIFGGDLSVSIPSSTVTTWLAGLTKRTFRLGVAVQAINLAELPTDVQRKVTPHRTSGLLIVGIEEKSEASDLLLGDILLNIAGTPVESAASLRQVLAQQSEQKPISLTLLRAGNITTVNATVQVGETLS